MMDGEVVFYGLLPITVLWNFREFRRDEAQGIGLPVAGIHYFGVERITDFIHGRGVDSLELCIIHDKALLTDGNHRIVAARRLGYKVIPVNIRVLKGDGSDLLYPHTLAYFKSISPELRQMFMDIFEKANYQHPPFISEE
jgi:hypothetical protein